MSDGFQGIRILTKEGVFKNDTLGQVFGLVKDNRGDLWIAAWSIQNVKLAGGIYRYDGKSFRNYQQDFGIRERGIFSIYYDQNQDLLWIGTEKEGMFRISLGYLTTYYPDYFNLERKNIKNLYLDSKNCLWISGDRELISLEPDGTWSFLNKKPMVDAYRKFWNDPGVRIYPRLLMQVLKRPSILITWKAGSLSIILNFLHLSVLSGSLDTSTQSAYPVWLNTTTGCGIQPRAEDSGQVRVLN